MEQKMRSEKTLVNRELTAYVKEIPLCIALTSRIAKRLSTMQQRITHYIRIAYFLLPSSNRSIEYHLHDG